MANKLEIDLLLSIKNSACGSKKGNFADFV